jgi:hypothetical protein
MCYVAKLILRSKSIEQKIGHCRAHKLPNANELCTTKTKKIIEMTPQFEYICSVNKKHKNSQLSTFCIKKKPPKSAPFA